MPGSRQPASRHVRRRASLILIVASTILSLATATAGPAAAARPGAPAHGLAATPHRNVSRAIGHGTRVDATRAARDAGLVQREHRTSALKHLDFGATKSHKITTSSRLAAVSGRHAAAGSGPSTAAVQPTPVATTSFPGIVQSQCGCEPPDPWVAVGPSHVVQTTNGAVRISNRSGTTLLTEPTWALFAVPPERLDTDPRILYDTFHGRWVGIISTFESGFANNGLRLAISETSDPTGAWTVYAIESGNFLPDFPSISSSSSRIVLTSDDFQDGVTFVGPTWLTIDWSNVLAGTDLFIGGFSYSTTAFGHFRAAQILSTATNTPVIYENGADPVYFEITGPATAPNAIDEHDLVVDFGAAAFSLPPVPVQPGAVAINNAVDERPTDAVYRGGALWFVATADAFDGTNHWDAARYTVVSTAANGTAPTASTDIPGANPGTHFFTPGVGVNADGSAFVVATKTDPTSTFPTTVVGAVLAGSGISPYQDIETSTAAYTGNRWGDFVGVAADPAGAGAVWISHELAAGDGSWRTSVVRVVSDGTAPSIPGAVSMSIVGGPLGGTVTVRTAWGAATDADSGVRGYLVERSDDSGPFVGLESPSAAISAPLRLAHRVQYRISAIDAVGNVGAPRLGPSYVPTLYQSTSSTAYTGSWATSSSAAYSGGSARASSTAGATATFTATSARNVAIVVTRATTRGSFKVYVDNVYRGTVSTYGSPTAYRRIIWQYGWSTAGTHKIKLVISGTKGHPRVDLDAFVVLR